MTSGHQTMACRSNPVHQLFLYGQQAKKSFYFSMVEKTQKSNKQYFITCENYETLVSVCTSQGFWGRGLADLLMYYLGLHSLQQQTWIDATETLCGLQRSEHQLPFTGKVCCPGGCSSDGHSVWCKPVPQAFENHSADWHVRLVWRCIFSASRSISSCWNECRLLALTVSVQRWRHSPGLLMLVTVKNQKLSFRSTYPLPPTHVPPKTCITTMVFSSIPACKQTAGWEINTIVWSGIALFLERLDNKYFRLAGHIVSAAITQHCHVTRKQPGTT